MAIPPYRLLLAPAEPVPVPNDLSNSILLSLTLFPLEKTLSTGASSARHLSALELPTSYCSLCCPLQGVRLSISPPLHIATEIAIQGTVHGPCFKQPPFLSLIRTLQIRNFTHASKLADSGHLPSYLSNIVSLFGRVAVQRLGYAISDYQLTPFNSHLTSLPQLASALEVKTHALSALETRFIGKISPSVAGPPWHRRVGPLRWKFTTTRLVHLARRWPVSTVLRVFNLPRLRLWTQSRSWHPT